MTVSNLGCKFSSDFDVVHDSSKKNVPIVTFNMLFENTQNKKQYGIKITCTEIRIKKLWWVKI